MYQLWYCVKRDTYLYLSTEYAENQTRPHIYTACQVVFWPTSLN